MSKLTIGKKRIKENRGTSGGYTLEGNILFSVGIAVMCAMLVFNIRTAKGDRDSFGRDAVAVMSSGVVSETKEELAMPEKSTSAEEEWTVYDYIGQMIADILFGER